MRHGVELSADDLHSLIDSSIETQVTLLQYHTAFADFRYQVQVVAHYNEGLTVKAQFFDLLDAFLLERFITDRQNLIHQENIRVRVNSD